MHFGLVTPQAVLGLDDDRVDFPADGSEVSISRARTSRLLSSMMVRMRNARPDHTASCMKSSAQI
jgi:hypothetical protein